MLELSLEWPSRGHKRDEISKLAKASVHDPFAVLQAVSVTSALNYAQQHTREGDGTDWQSSSRIMKIYSQTRLLYSANPCLMVLD